MVAFLKIAILSVAIAVYSAGGAHADEAKKCYSIDDNDSPFFTDLGDLADVLNFNHTEVKRTLRKYLSLPLLQHTATCVASLRIASAFSKVIGIIQEGKCKKAYDQIKDDSVLKQLLQHSKGLLTLEKDKLEKFATFAKQVASNVHDEHCSRSKENLAPCVVNKVIPLIMEILRDHSEGCCVQALKEVEKNLGKKLDDLLYKVISMVFNFACAKRSPLQGDGSSQTCGYTFTQALFSSGQWVNNVLAFMQIPNSNEQACKAYTGEKFLALPHSPGVEWSIKPKAKAVDACAEGIDAIVSFAHEVPYLTENPDFTLKGIRVNDLFEDGKCVPGTKFVDLLPPDLGNNEYVQKIRDACMRFSSGFLCDFQATLTEFPMPEQ